jgi:hypothetical protein
MDKHAAYREEHTKSQVRGALRLFGATLAWVLVLLPFSSSALAQTAWERYLDEPNAGNAGLVTTLAYSQPREGGYDAGDLEILKLQVLAGDPSAYALAFRLRSQADGGLAEDLGAILASAIRPHPEFFLRQVAALDASCAGFDIDVAGLEYVDRPGAQAYELHARVAAIAAIGDPSLQTVRANCLARLGRDR